MFEHADRDDPVECAPDRAIIEQLEPDMVADARSGGASAGDVQLLLRQRDAGDIDAGDSVEVQSEAAPATADIKDALPGAEIELGGDVGFLRRLRFLQPCIDPGEIAAAILEIVVQKESVEPARQVVMMRGIATGLPLPIPRLPRAG